MDIKRTSLIILITSLIINALIAVGIFLFGDFSGIEGKILWTTITLSLYSMSGLYFGKMDKAILKYSGISIAVIALLLTITGIWAEEGELIWKTIGSFFVLSIAISYLFFLQSGEKELHKIIQMVINITSVLVFIIAVMVTILIWAEFDIEGLYLRLIGVFAVLAVLGTVMKPLLNKLLKSSSVAKL